MLIITPTEFDTYTNNFDDSPLKQMYCETAQFIVESYLSYALTAADYTETIKGQLLSLGAYPVNSITSLTIDGTAITADQYEIVKNVIKITDENLILNKYSKTVVSYNAGYPVIEDVDGDYVELPSVFKNVVLKIASLLMLEESGNIGVTGLSADNGISRTFINYTNYNKHLAILSSYRVIRFKNVSIL